MSLTPGADDPEVEPLAYNQKRVREIEDKDKPFADVLSLGQLARHIFCVTQGEQNVVIRRDAALGCPALRWPSLLLFLARLGGPRNPRALLSKLDSPLLYLDEDVDEFGIPHGDRFSFPQQRFELPLAALRSRAHLFLQFLHQRVVPVDDLSAMLCRLLADDIVDVVRLGVAQFMSTIANLGPDLVGKVRRECLVATRLGALRHLVEDAPRDAELRERVLELVPIA